MSKRATRAPCAGKPRRTVPCQKCERASRTVQAVTELVDSLEGDPRASARSFLGLGDGVRAQADWLRATCACARKETQ